MPPKPAGTHCRAVSRASRPALAAEARRNALPSGIYASRLMTQKRLRLAHQATDANACPLGTVAFPCATPSRLSCAGDILSPVPLWVAKRIQSPPKSMASIGIPCKMRSADLASGYRYSNVTTTQKLSTTLAFTPVGNFENLRL
ncbi:MAG: hypothetical protein IJG33_01240 [Selenomonadaceae bacterium]|nr:hypothetical protein [Selenomonadaceae bacterium]